MKRPEKGREITVGITLTLALVTLAGLILMLGQESRMFRPRTKYLTRLTTSQGLKTGSPVVMGGVQIGAITSIALPRELAGPGIDIELSVDRGYADRIREGSLVSIGYITLLSGEKFIDVSQGDPSRPVLPGGSILPLDKSETLFETGQNAAENLAAVTNQLRDVLDEIMQGEGLVGKLIKEKDPYFGQQVVDQLGAALQRTSSLLDRVEKGEGTLGRLLMDEKYADETLGAVKSAATRLDRALEAIEERKGILGDLIRDEGQGKQLIEDLRSTSSALKSTAAKLESKQGLLGRILNDPEYSESVATDLRRISSGLSSIVGKIDRGEGTIGALVNDREVYDGLHKIVKGVSKSKFATSFLRHYEKKGEKEIEGEHREEKKQEGKKPEGQAPEGQAPQEKDGEGIAPMGKEPRG